MILYFDFDGTIADTAEGIAHALSLAFEAHHLPKPSLSAVKGKMGFPLKEIMSSLADRPLTEHALQQLIQTYRKKYQAISADYIRLFPGMDKVIAESSRLAQAMAIVTNKVTAGARQDLNAVHLAEYFKVIVGSDRVEAQKPAPDPLQKARMLLGVENAAKGLVIGDSSADMMMAHTDGLPAIGVTWGSKSAKDLKKAGAASIAATPQELWTIIQDFAARS